MTRRIDWYFVFGTAAQVFVAFCSILVCMVVLIVGLSMLPVDSDMEKLRGMASLFLSTQLPDIGPMERASLVVGVALLYIARATETIHFAFTTNGGIDQEEYQLMARVAALGWSLSIAYDEGYFAVSTSQERVRLLRVHDVEDFIRTQEEYASTAAITGSDHVHAAVQ